MAPYIGILVFTTQATIDLKRTDRKYSDNRHAYWTTKRFPTRFVTPENVNKEWRLYMATNGIVQGYFIIDDIRRNDLLFDGNSWISITNGEHLKPHQGWKYY